MPTDRRKTAVRGTKSKAKDAVPVGGGQDELFESLMALGLSQNESRAYLAVLGGVEMTATETAARSGVPRPKVYEALASLESRGFCRSVGGPVRRFSALDPDVALRRWLDHRDGERHEAAEQDRVHVDLLFRLLPRPAPATTVEIPDFIEAVSGRLPTSEMLEDVAATSTRTLYGLLQPPFLQPRARWNTKEIEAIERGVDVRVIYTPEGIEDPYRYRPLMEAGGKVRIVDHLPMKLLIKDSSEALISLRDANTGAQSVTTARVRHVDLVAPLESLFKRVWRKATPID